MHRTVDYDRFPTENKEVQALKDTKQWLGTRKFNQLTKLFREQYIEPMELSEFRIACSFVGIQGFPCYAWHNYIWPEQ